MPYGAPLARTRRRRSQLRGEWLYWAIRPAAGRKASSCRALSSFSKALVQQPPMGADWVHEIKFDGYRMQLRVADGAAVLRTRKGLDWTVKFPAIAKAATPLPPSIIDGEVVALNHAGIPDFSALQTAIAAGRSQDLIFFCLLDLLFLNDQDQRALPLLDRKRQLQRLIEPLKSDRIRYVQHFENRADAVLKSACTMALEGIVSSGAMPHGLFNAAALGPSASAVRARGVVIGRLTTGERQRALRYWSASIATIISSMSAA